MKKVLFLVPIIIIAVALAVIYNNNKKAELIEEKFEMAQEAYEDGLFDDADFHLFSAVFHGGYTDENMPKEFQELEANILKALTKQRFEMAQEAYEDGLFDDADFHLFSAVFHGGYTDGNMPKEFQELKANILRALTKQRFEMAQKAYEAGLFDDADFHLSSAVSYGGYTNEDMPEEFQELRELISKKLSAEDFSLSQEKAEGLSI